MKWFWYNSPHLSWCSGKMFVSLGILIAHLWLYLAVGEEYFNEAPNFSLFPSENSTGWRGAS